MRERLWFFGMQSDHEYFQCRIATSTSDRIQMQFRHVVARHIAMRWVKIRIWFQLLRVWIQVNRTCVVGLHFDEYECFHPPLHSHWSQDHVLSHELFQELHRVDAHPHSSVRWMDDVLRYSDSLRVNIQEVGIQWSMRMRKYFSHFPWCLNDARFRVWERLLWYKRVPIHPRWWARDLHSQQQVHS